MSGAPASLEPSGSDARRARLHVLGINHQTAPVDLREQVAIAGEAVPVALASLRALEGVREVALLSTCNRTELYALADAGDVALARWLGNAGRPGGDASAPLDAYLYRHSDEDAVRHLFRVATGLDSLVLGEPQILGQVKDAWLAARGAGTLGGHLDRLFQHAFATAKRARTATRIGANPVSVASAAVRLARESFAPLPESTALLVGAGETIELAARHLREGGIRRLLVANRTLAHAQELASRHGGVALPLDALPRHLEEADVVLSATASREPVIAAAHVAEALARRRHRPMLLLDLAVPRDVEPAVAGLRDAFLYTVDDLERAVEDNRRGRREAAAEAESIIDLQAGRFMESLNAGQRLAPLRQLRAHGERTRDAVLARARQQLAAGRDPAEVLDQFARLLTNRLLHAPTTALRDAALRGDGELARAAERLFPADAEQLDVHPADGAPDPAADATLDADRRDPPA
ncbi:glutamyl-tRNA reductase [Luteimonas pelagia]